MTNEEAKEVLELIEEDIDCGGCRYFPDKEHCECEDECLYATALKVAIKALEKEPILHKIFCISHPLSIMSTPELEHKAIMQIAEMLEPLCLPESEEE